MRVSYSILRLSRPYAIWLTISLVVYPAVRPFVHVQPLYIRRCEVSTQRSTPSYPAIRSIPVIYVHQFVHLRPFFQAVHIQLYTPRWQLAHLPNCNSRPFGRVRRPVVNSQASTQSSAISITSNRPPSCPSTRRRSAIHSHLLPAVKLHPWHVTREGRRRSNSTHSFSTSRWRPPGWLSDDVCQPGWPLLHLRRQLLLLVFVPMSNVC